MASDVNGSRGVSPADSAAAHLPNAGASQLPSPITPLVGRERELAAARDLLLSPEGRLLTFTGPGGVGKTRLAIELARDVAGTFANGSAFVPFGPVRSPRLVASTIFRALGGREVGGEFSLDQLHLLIGDRQLLLVLDNFEHLISAADVVTGLLDACPRIKVLVTSRVALRLSREQEFQVPPLSLTEAEDGAVSDGVQGADAARLFILRATAARADFAAAPEMLPVIGAICQRLDGLPLAIELAAARVTHLSPRALIEQMDRPGVGRLPLLIGGPRDLPARQQTMRDTIAWSYDLLDDTEQALGQRLSVFVDGFSLDAAAAVCAMDEVTVLDGIASLVAKSLVQYEGDRTGVPRYGMLETIREFGLERLAADGREAETRFRHAEWALDLAERTAPLVQGPDQTAGLAALSALELEDANLRAALGWLAERGDGQRLARLAGSLWPFWDERARYAEGRRWLEEALRASAVDEADVRMRLLTAAGSMAWRQTDFPRAIQYHGQALALAQAAGDREAEAFALNNLGVQAKEMGDFAEARIRYETSIAIAREAGLVERVIMGLHNLAQIQRVQHESAAALRSMEEVLALARAHGVLWPLPSMLNALGLTASDLGDHERAMALFREALSLALAKGNLGSVVDGIESLARLAAVTGQARAAIRLFAAAEALREDLTTPLSPTDIAYRAPVLQILQETLGAERFATTWRDGRALSLEQAIAEARALRVDAAGQTPSLAERRAAELGLTERELEVLRLMADGLSNREIGAALYISQSTAARHVANIYNKLGINSRVEATALVHQHDLS